MYVSCCVSSLKGKFDFLYDKENGTPFNRVYFVNPFKNSAWYQRIRNTLIDLTGSARRSSSTQSVVGIVLNDDLVRVEEPPENHTDTDTC